MGNNRRVSRSLSNQLFWRSCIDDYQRWLPCLAVLFESGTVQSKSIFPAGIVSLL
jgi:hypothetical protein